MQSCSQFFIFLFVFVAFISPFGLMADQKESLESILQNILRCDDEMHQKMKRFEYDQHVLTRKYNSAGKEVEKKELTMRGRPGGRTLLSVVADKSGVVKTEDESALNDAKAAQDSRKIVSKFSVRDLLPRFDVWLIGEEAWQNYPAYVLGFKPKAKGNQKPFADRMEKVLAHLAGKIWVSKTDYIILRTEAELSEPVDLAWFFANMQSMSFRFEAQRVSGLGFVPKSFMLDYKVRILTSISRHHQIVTMSGHRPTQDK
jgi:hypothetical protein